MFVDSIRSAGDWAGVYEYDGETGYFYLYKTSGDSKINGAIQVTAGTVDFREQDIAILWDHTEEKVGLFIHGQLWAVFDTQKGTKHGGSYKVDGSPKIPTAVREGFKNIN